MAGMARGRDRANFKWRDADNITVLQNSNAFLRHRGNSSPQSFHLIAIETGSGSDQFCGIDEMRRAARMHVNYRAEFRETPRRAGMIEMDVTEKNMPDITDGEAPLRKLRDHGLEGRLRAGIEKDQAIIGLERSRGDDAAPAEVLRIENVNHYQSSLLGDKLGRGFFGAVPRAVRGSNLSMVSQCRCRMAKNGNETTVFAVALLKRKSRGPRDGSRI
jgi:hypothetical protein